MSIGGIAEMLDPCGAHGITADIEMIPIDRIETACSRMLKRDVKSRFVIERASLPKAASFTATLAVRPNQAR